MKKHRNTSHHFSRRGYGILTLACSLLYSTLVYAGTFVQHSADAGHKNTILYCHTAECLRQQELAQKALEEAKQAGRAYSKIYVRDDWPHWLDANNDCQNTRVEILIARSTKKVRHNHNNRCYKVITGEWYDPYTHRTFTNADQVDIDHIIALAEAHRYGGADWSHTRKKNFANDPINLIPVEREANQAKSSLPAHQWMPKNLAYWCEYIRSREAVVQKYALEFPEKERLFNAQIKQEHCR